MFGPMKMPKVTKCHLGIFRVSMSQTRRSALEDSEIDSTI